MKHFLMGVVVSSMTFATLSQPAQAALYCLSQDQDVFYHCLSVQVELRDLDTRIRRLERR